jgi:hypothetical protein
MAGDGTNWVSRVYVMRWGICDAEGWSLCCHYLDLINAPQATEQRVTNHELCHIDVVAVAVLNSSTETKIRVS